VLAAVLEMVGHGDLTSSGGQAIAGMIEAYGKGFELTDSPNRPGENRPDRMRNTAPDCKKYHVSRGAKIPETGHE
jgi:hypothetical protein